MRKFVFGVFICVSLIDSWVFATIDENMERVLDSVSTIQELVEQYPIPQMRIDILVNIDKLKQKRLIPKIVNILVEDPSTAVRRTVVEIVGSLDNKREVERNLNILEKDSDPFVKGWIPVVIVRSSLKERNILRRMQVLANDSHPWVKKKVAENVGFLNNKRAVEQILNMLVNDPDPQVKEGVVRGAVMLGLSGGSLLNILMRDLDPGVRSSIPYDIFHPTSNIREENRVTGLRAMAQDEHPLVRKAVAINVIQLEDDNKVKEILNLQVKDTDLRVIHQVMKTALKVDQEFASRIVSNILIYHSDLAIKSKDNEFIRSNFPDLFSQTDFAASGSCEAGFTK